MGIRAIPIPIQVVSHSLPFPILSSVPIPIGNPIPMVISSSDLSWKPIFSDKSTLHDSSENVVEECNPVTVTVTVQTRYHTVIPIGRNLLAGLPRVACRPSRYWSRVPSPMPTSANLIHFVWVDSSLVPRSRNLVIDVPCTRTQSYTEFLFENFPTSRAIGAYPPARSATSALEQIYPIIIYSFSVKLTSATFNNASTR